jgi:hypothetical protein
MEEELSVRTVGSARRTENWERHHIHILSSGIIAVFAKIISS